MNSLIQINLNRSFRAYDLLQQTMIESGTGIAAISEPPFASNKANWFHSKSGLAAIYYRPKLLPKMPTLIYQGNDVVATRIGDIDLVSCYISPNIPRGEFLEFLDELNVALTHLSNKILVCGDFNSKSKLWGSPYSDERGTTVEE